MQTFCLTHLPNCAVAYLFDSHSTGCNAGNTLALGAIQADMGTPGPVSHATYPPQRVCFTQLWAQLESPKVRAALPTACCAHATNKPSSAQLRLVLTACWSMDTARLGVLMSA